MSFHSLSTMSLEAFLCRALLSIFSWMTLDLPHLHELPPSSCSYRLLLLLMDDFALCNFCSHVYIRT